MRGSYARVLDAVGAARPLLVRGDLVVVVLTGPGRVDLVLLDALARLALNARRCGGELQVRVESVDVQRLAELTGLSAVLPLVTGSGQTRREPEPGEELGAEKMVDVRDPSG